MAGGNETEQTQSPQGTPLVSVPLTLKKRSRGQQLSFLFATEQAGPAILLDPMSPGCLAGHTLGLVWGWLSS